MLTFPNVTPAVFEAVLNELRQSATVRSLEAISNGSQHWLIEGNGIVAEAVRMESGTVHVAVRDKPWWMPEAVIAAKIESAIEAAQAAIGGRA
jgi:uncharacterized Fe-S cluster protein YjdI